MKLNQKTDKTITVILPASFVKKASKLQDVFYTQTNPAIFTIQCSIKSFLNEFRDNFIMVSLMEEANIKFK